MQETLKTLHEKYVSMKETSNGEKCYSQTAIVGDQGTVERGINVLLQLSNGFDEKERLDGIHFEIADFHGGMKLLQVSKNL